MTRAEAVEQLRTLGTVAVWNLAVPAVIIRPHRDGWLIFLRGGHAWYGTAEAAADALLAGSTAAAYPPDSADQAPTAKKGCSRPCWHGRPPDTRQPLAGPGTTGLAGSARARRRGVPVYREPSRRPCRMHCPVTPGTA